jgi:mannan endo-1,4-beta-mannosidase
VVVGSRTPQQPQSQHHHHGDSKRAAPSTASAAKTCLAPESPNHYLGVVIYRPWHKTLPRFEQQSGVQPKMIEYYVRFGAPFDMAAMKKVDRSAFLILQIDPDSSPLQNIIDGQYDGYLKTMAKAVARYRCPIAISFAHEMNGDWYPWGSTHVTPAVYITAWRHVFNVFAAAGAHNVIWTWTVNRVSPYVSGIKEWWPGQKYVDWVGIDGYVRTAGQSFSDIFGQTIKQIHSLTTDPVVITETAVTRAGPQAANIKGLFAGARQAGVLGLVWFDVYGQINWTLTGRPPAVLAAFREAVEAFEG